MKKKRFVIRLAVFLSLLLAGFSHWAPAEEGITDHTPDLIYRMLDEEGGVLLETGRDLQTGESFLDQDNRLYEIRWVDPDRGLARAAFVEEVELPETSPHELPPGGQNLSPPQMGNAAGEDGDREGRIALYHTHNAESYIPTDGTHSIDGRGGIHQVGASFRGALEDRGVDVIHSQKLHLPHDRGAYRRSRSTVLELLERNLDILFDIHRDAAPRDAYREEVAGQEVTQIMFVVGQQNPTYELNRELALGLKRTADEIHPGLIRGIFFSQADFNQDLSPMNLLLEVGSHTNSREAAERGIRLFAEPVTTYLYGPEGIERRPRDLKRESRAGFILALELVGLVLIATAGLYVINAGGPAEAQRRLVEDLRRLKHWWCQIRW